MQDAGFDQYDSDRYPSHMDWERHILETPPTKLALKTLFAAPVLEFLAMFEQEGMIPSEELQRELRALAAIDQPAFDDKLYEARIRLYWEIDWFQKSIGLTDDPATVPPQKVVEYLTTNNPYFRRWLEFGKVRPRRDPKDWDAYAAMDLKVSEVPYAIAMRDLGQLLQSMISMRRRLSEDLVMALMHSHTLKGEERYWQTAAWIHEAGREAIR